MSENRAVGATLATFHATRAVQHEAWLLVVRDLVVLIVVVVVFLWIARELGRRGGP